MSKAFELKPTSKCGICKNLIKEGDIFRIIYKDDDSGKIKHLICDNCEVDDCIQAYRDTKHVDSHLSLQACMAQYYFEQDAKLSGLRADARHFFLKYKKDLLEIADGTDKIKKLIQEFEEKHWLPYLKKYWNDTDLRGHEAKVKTTKLTRGINTIDLLMWGCAGRVLITIKCNDQSLTMIFTDGKSQITPNGGQQGIEGKVNFIINMMEVLVEVKEIKFQPESSVKLAGL